MTLPVGAGAFPRSLSLDIPADATFMATARLFASAAGRTLRLSEERVQDLKVVLSEICASGVDRGHGHISIAVEWDGEQVSVEGRGAGDLQASGEPDDAAAHRWRLLQSLVSVTSCVREADGTTTIQFEIPR